MDGTCPSYFENIFPGDRIINHEGMTQHLTFTKNHQALICCLKALENLNSPTIFFANTTSPWPQSELVIPIKLDRVRIFTLLNVANSLSQTASLHINRAQPLESQIILNKYLYRFRYFYKSWEDYLKNDPRYAFNTLDLNNMALKTLFQLM